MANIFNKAIAFITIPIFARLLTTQEYGNVSTYSSYVMILQYFMGLSSEYTIRNAYVEFKDDIPVYMASIYSLSTICSLLVVVVVITVNSVFVKVSSFFVCVCCLCQAFMAFLINAMTYNYMMEKKHIKRVVLIAGPNFLSVLFGISFVLMLSSHRDIGRIIGYVLAFTIVGTWCLASVFIQNGCSFNTKYWHYILKIAPPLVAHGLSMAALSQLDRIMLTSIRNASETGIYSIIYSLSMVALAVTQALQGIWTPWFTEKYILKEYEQINKKANEYLLLIANLTTIIMLIAPEILKAMAPSSYWGGIKMIPPLVLSSYFIYAYSYFVGLELHEKMSKNIAVLTLVSTGTNAILNYIFIPKYGALAAAFTTLFSYFLLFVLHWWSCNRINANIFMLRRFIVPSALVIASSVVFYLMERLFVVRWLVATIVMLFAFLRLKDEFVK